MPRVQVPKNKQQKRIASIAGRAQAAFKAQSRMQKEASEVLDVVEDSMLEEDDVIATLSDIEEDVLQIGQPTGSWAIAESKLPGSNPAAAPSRQLKYYYKKKNAEARTKMQRIYGSISRFFPVPESSYTPPNFEIALPQD